MGQMSEQPGRFMAAEIAEAPGVFARAVTRDWRDPALALGLDQVRAIYTIAHGSSDAAATILSYEIIAQRRIPVTSRPPSAFSIHGGIAIAGAASLVISQSGASDDLVTSARRARQDGRVVAITNQPGSAVEAEADLCLPVDAGVEQAVPATKTVIGSIGAGIALLAALEPACAEACAVAGMCPGTVGTARPPGADVLAVALGRAQHVYVIGRRCSPAAARRSGRAGAVPCRNGRAAAADGLPCRACDRPRPGS